MLQEMSYSAAGMGQYPPSYERSYPGQHPSMGMPPSSMGGGYRVPPMGHHDGGMGQWSASTQHPPIATQQVCACVRACVCVEQYHLIASSFLHAKFLATIVKNVNVIGQPFVYKWAYYPTQYTYVLTYHTCLFSGSGGVGSPSPSIHPTCNVGPHSGSVRCSPAELAPWQPVPWLQHWSPWRPVQTTSGSSRTRHAGVFSK